MTGMDKLMMDTVVEKNETRENLPFCNCYYGYIVNSTPDVQLKEK